MSSCVPTVLCVHSECHVSSTNISNVFLKVTFIYVLIRSFSYLHFCMYVNLNEIKFLSVRLLSSMNLYLFMSLLLYTYCV